MASPSTQAAPLHPRNPSPSFDHVLSRLQRLTIPSSQSPTSLVSHVDPAHLQKSVFALAPDTTRFSTHVDCTLGASFSMVFPSPSKTHEQDVPTLIDTFAPKPLPSDLSPTSTSSSDLDSVSSQTSNPRLSFEAFLSSRSRVVRLYNLPSMAETFLTSLFSSPMRPSGLIPVPVSMWSLRHIQQIDSVWAVFKTHEEACSALSLSGPAMSVATALESDLEPFGKLKRFLFKPPSTNDSTFPPSPSLARPKSLHPSSSLSDLHKAMNVSEFGGFSSRNEYTLSTNPPNPRTNFRLGDWICSSPNCAAHNFGRNLSCIGCGYPRSSNSASNLPNPPSRATPSPRFASFNSANQFVPTPAPQDLAPILNIQRPNNTPAPHASNQRHSSHPLLTPSGRAFAIGGRVQNISSDPLSPCIMYWPDNEPFPEQGQIRPSGLAGVPQPPILNTGNKGPITHQPGDWICQKCNYLNWRRRKVCQTCLPYAEGNGDSVSAAVQAERIALLTSLLSQTRLMPPSVSPTPANRSHSLTPPQVRRNLSASPSATSQGTVHRSHSHLDLGTQYSQSRPIYQTSGYRQPSPLYSTRPSPEHHLDAPAPLLPSFLQDIVQVPALSPSSTTSADISIEDYDGSPSPTSGLPLPSSIATSPMGNIWKMDGEESKSLSAYALPNPNRQKLVSSARKPSHERLRVQVISS